MSIELRPTDIGTKRKYVDKAILLWKNIEKLETYVSNTTHLL